MTDVRMDGADPAMDGERDRFLQRVADHGPFGLVITDEHDQITTSNATFRRWVGHDIDDRTTFQSLLVAGDRIYYDTHIRPLLQLQHEVRELAVELLSSDRQRIPVLLNGVRRVDDGAVRIEYAMFDARERRQYERELLRERQAAERSERRLQLLNELLIGMSDADSVEEILEVVTGSGAYAPDGAGCSAWLFENGHLAAVRVGSVAGVPDFPDRLEASEATEALEMLTAGHAVVVEDATDEETCARHPLICQWLTAAGRRSAIVAPLRSSSGLIGALTYGFRDAHVFDDREQRDVESLAIQTAEAIRRAQMHEAVLIARQQADLRSRIFAALNRSQTPEDVARALTDDGRSAFGADTIALFTVEGDRLELVSLSSTSTDAANLVASITPSTPTVLEAFSTMAPVFVDDWTEVAELIEPSYRTIPYANAALLPLADGDQPLGLVVALYDTPDIPTSVRVALRGVSAEASVAIRRTRAFAAERRVAMTLQKAMLPQRLPDVEGWRLDVSHDAGTADLLVGGDFYDVTAFDDGRIVLVVGDVVGHGLGSATAMGQLRSAAKALAMEGHNPTGLLAGLEAFAADVPGALHASVCCVAIEADGKASYVCAGHPFPLLVQPDGTSEFLTQGRSGVLGIPHDGLVEDRLVLEPGAAILLYTDGLVERRGRDIAVGHELLRERVTASVCASPEPARTIARLMTMDAAPDDDVVALVARRRHPDDRPPAPAAPRYRSVSPA